MGDKTEIVWCDATWNPVTGCTKVSPGCKFCYAEVVAERMRHIKGSGYENVGFDLTLRPERLDQPRRWKKPRLIFVNSMSDLFHKDIPMDFIHKVFHVMNDCPHHVFQILTKRPELMASYCNYLREDSAGSPEPKPILLWTPNIWAGTSVENQDYVHRIDSLRAVPAHVRFLSIEPLLGEIKELDLKNIHWVIVGGESGNNARPMDKAWVLRLKDICEEQGVPFLFKQWGGTNKKATGRLLDGKTYDGYPKHVDLTPFQR